MTLPPRGCGEPLPPWKCGETMPSGVVALCDACAGPTLPAGQAPPGFRVGDTRHVALWDAVNDYAEACGGRMSSVSVQRMTAVARVEKAVRDILEPLPAEQPAPTCTYCGPRESCAHCEPHDIDGTGQPQGARPSPTKAELAESFVNHMRPLMVTEAGQRLMDQAAPDGGRLSERMLLCPRCGCRFEDVVPQMRIAALEAKLAAAERNKDEAVANERARLLGDIEAEYGRIVREVCEIGIKKQEAIRNGKPAP